MRSILFSRASFIAICTACAMTFAGWALASFNGGVRGADLVYQSGKEVKLRVVNWPEVPYQLDQMGGDDQSLTLKSGAGNSFKESRMLGDESGEWVKKLKFRFTNTTDKDISYLLVNLIFPAPDPSKPKPGPTIYMYVSGAKSSHFPDVPVIKPGESIKIQMQEKFYESFKELCESNGIKDLGSIEEARIEFAEIGFSDGTAWQSGLYYQPDPDNPNRMIQIKKVSVNKEKDRNKISLSTASLPIKSFISTKSKISFVSSIPGNNVFPSRQPAGCVTPNPRNIFIVLARPAILVNVRPQLWFQ